MNIKETTILGCLEIESDIIIDERGSFVKMFHEEIFAHIGMYMHIAEQFYSRSRKNVLRGLHFHVPPKDHGKLVYLLQGRVMDVVVDLRKGSPCFGKHEVFELDAEKARAIYIPSGLAHGYYALSECVMLYNVSGCYSPGHDAGILWDSVGISWPEKQPIISERDQHFVRMEDFNSPFEFSRRKKEF